jgi:hypothetical protein
MDLLENCGTSCAGRVEPAEELVLHRRVKIERLDDHRGVAKQNVSCAVRVDGHAEPDLPVVALTQAAIDETQSIAAASANWQILAILADIFPGAASIRRGLR